MAPFSPLAISLNYASNLCGRGSGSLPSAIKIFEGCDLRLAAVDEGTEARGAATPKVNKIAAKIPTTSLDFRMYPPKY